MSYQKEFIDMIQEAAIQHQLRFGIPAAVSIAQACLETGYGKYILKDINTGKDSKNLFNIKGEGNNGSVLAWSTEYKDGEEVKVQAKFKAYLTYGDSFADHGLLLLTERYAPCMAVKDDPLEFARKLQECGYATDPQYAEKLISLMNRYDLLNLKIVDEIAEILKDFKEKGLLNSPDLWAKVFKGEARANPEYSEILLTNMMKKLKVDMISVMVEQLKEAGVINTPAVWREVFKGNSVVNVEYAKIFLKNLKEKL